MNDNNEINRVMLETSILIIVMSVIGILGIYFMPLILVLFPIPFVILGIKNGIVTNIINMVITCVIIGMIDSPSYGIFLIIVFVPLSIALSYLIKKRRSSMEILGISTAVLFISIFISLSLTNAGTLDFVNKLEQGYKEMMTNQLETFKESGLSSFELLEKEESLEQTYKLSLLIIPAVLLTLSLVVSYINYFLISIWLSRIGINIISIPRFSKFTLPSNLVPGVMVMFLSIWIMGKVDFIYTDVVLMNLVSLVGFMLFIQGIAVADHFLKRFNIYPIVRFIVYIMFLFNQSMMLVLTILGLVDNIFDFRKIKKIKL